MLLRPLRIFVFGFLLLLLLALGVLGFLTWRNHTRIETARLHLQGMIAFERSFLTLERMALDELGAAAGRSGAPERLATQLHELLTLGEPFDPSAARKLEDLERRLASGPEPSEAHLRETLALADEIAAAAREDQERRLTALEAATRRELALALAAPPVLLALGLVILAAAQRRLLRPLRDLGSLLARLSDGELTPVDPGHVDPLILPLFENFNALVGRLRELEAAYRSHAASLEREVRSATRALLEQQQSLARAERLAATGELAASVAHELRNPLAGIQMTLGNLRRELGEPELAARIDLVLAELNRLARLADELLSRARHAPEPAREIELGEVVQELFTLLRYQLPGDVRLELRSERPLRCKLPEDGLRQTLLNLILNAARALGERGGTVTVEADACEGGLALQVLDDGPGFPPRLLDAGVRPFVQAGGEGTGLGLAIVRRFARELGGQMTLANREPHGACVRLVLPCPTGHG